MIIEIYFLADFGLIASDHDSQVGLESARVNDLVVVGLIERVREQDIRLDRVVLDPRVLSHVRGRAVHV